ncbi:MAG: hypothetical protein KAG66_00555 [Methylococcales bacterium]|nr:hypothetical protein [Methylococcales bacterium]
MGAGLNNYGQLGLGHTNPVNAFTPIPLDNVAKMSVGYGFTMVVDENGVLYGAGRNDHNQLTDSNPPGGVSTFTPIGANVLDVVCSFYGSRALLADGSWRTTGSHGGQTRSGWEPLSSRDGLSSSNSVPRLISDGYACEHRPYTDPLNGSAKRKSSGPLDDTAYYTFMLLPSFPGNSEQYPSGPQPGTSYYRANPTLGAVPGPLPATPVTAVFAGGGQAVFYIAESGDLYGVFDNRGGQYGIGVKTARGTSVPPEWVLIGPGYEELRVERQITFAKTLNGIWYAAGRNIYGSMGLGDTNERLTFTSIGEFYDLQAGTTDTLGLKEQRDVLLTPDFPPPRDR